jgi:hypothetical protein
METIKSKFMNVDFNINLFLHFLILYTFLTIFFINFISKVSSDAFNGEVTNLIHNQLNNKIDNLKKNPIFSTILDFFPINTLKQLFSQPDKAVNNYNQGLFNLCILSTALLWIGFIVVVLILKYNCNSSLAIGEIIMENLLIFSAIGFAEYYFFTRIATKFVPVEPSFITKQFFESIKTQL